MIILYNLNLYLVLIISEFWEGWRASPGWPRDSCGDRTDRTGITYWHASPFHWRTSII